MPQDAWQSDPLQPPVTAPPEGGGSPAEMLPPQVADRGHAEIQPGPPIQPPPQVAGIRVGPQPHHHHRHRRHEYYVAYSVAIGTFACLFTVMAGLLVWALNEQHRATVDAAGTAPRSVAPANPPPVALGSPAHIAARQPPADEAADQPDLPTTGISTDFSFSADQAWTGENLFASDTAFDPQTIIDDLVMRQLATLEIEPANLCSDEVFLRRLYLDTMGTLPTAEEAAGFLDDPDPEKRRKLIEEVLRRPEFADYQAMKWCDILRVKAEFPIKLWPNAAQAYHRWVRTAIQENMPYDEFARQLLTSSGSNFRKPQVNFYRAVQSKTPEGIAQVVALTFLCARAEAWEPERLEGMSRFFSQVGYKGTGEWKEEIVFFDRRLGREQAADGPLTAVLPSGKQLEIPPGTDPRLVFTDWLVDKRNRWSSRAIANRIWFWMMGRGIVDPPDDVRPDNPATNKLLLNYLGTVLVEADYDLRDLYRRILNSQTYQLACTHSAPGSLAAENFAYAHVRRLDAEVLIDAICQITGTSETYSSIIPEPFTFLPEGQRAIALPDGSITSPFLEMFGRPTRDTGLESDRNNKLTARQALHLLNSNHFRNKLKRGPAMRELLDAPTSPAEKAERLYLTILSRRPTEDERAVAEGLCGYQGGARDVAWALINSDEFLFRH